MKNEQIQEFFTKVANDEKFKAKVEEFNKKVTAKTISEKDGKDFINKVVLPAAKKLGYKFTIDELATFFNSQDGANLTSLSPEDLENVSGGVFSLVGTLAAAVIGMLGMAAGGAATTHEFTPQAVLHRQVEQKKEELKTDKTSIPNVIANMLETLNSPEVLWDIDRMDEKTKVSFLARLDQVCDATTQDNFRNFVIFYTNDKGNGYGIQSVGNPHGAYESKVLHALVRLKQAYHAPEVDSKLTVPELKLIFGDDYAKLAESMPQYRPLVEKLFDTMNDELVRWDLRNVSDDQENFVKNFDLVMSAVERDAGSHYSIPWGDTYGSEELDSQKLYALFELKSSIDNQHAGTEPMVEKATLKNIFGNSYEAVIEDVPMWRTYINDVVQTLNDPDVDWNLDKLQDHDRNDLVIKQLRAIDSNVEYVNGALVIPACGIDEGYGATKEEVGTLYALIHLYNTHELAEERNSIPEAPTNARSKYEKISANAEMSELVKSELQLYLGSPDYENFEVKNTQHVNDFIKDRTKTNSQLKKDKQAQTQIREYLMGDEAEKLSDEDKREMYLLSLPDYMFKPILSAGELEVLLGQDLALKLREDQQNRLQARLDQSAKELADRQDKLDKDEAQLTEDTKTLRENQQLLSEQTGKLEQDTEKLEQDKKNLAQDKKKLEQDIEKHNTEYQQRTKELNDQYANLTKEQQEEHSTTMFKLLKDINLLSTRTKEKHQEIAKQKSELEEQKAEQDAEAQRLETLKAELEKKQENLAKQETDLKAWEAAILDYDKMVDAKLIQLDEKQVTNQQLLENLKTQVESFLTLKSTIQSAAAVLQNQSGTMFSNIEAITDEGISTPTAPKTLRPYSAPSATVSVGTSEMLQQLQKLNTELGEREANIQKTMVQHELLLKNLQSTLAHFHAFIPTLNQATSAIQATDGFVSVPAIKADKNLSVLTARLTAQNGVTIETVDDDSSNG